jgi:hypothetical protein
MDLENEETLKKFTDEKLKDEFIKKQYVNIQ